MFSSRQWDQNCVLLTPNPFHYFGAMVTTSLLFFHCAPIGLARAMDSVPNSVQQITSPKMTKLSIEEISSIVADDVQNKQALITTEFTRDIQLIVSFPG